VIGAVFLSPTRQQGAPPKKRTLADGAAWPACTRAVEEHLSLGAVVSTVPLSPTGKYPRAAVPAAEIEHMARLIDEHPNLLLPSKICEAESSLGYSILPDPLSSDVSARIAEALKSGTAYSVVRIGDGEANLLSFDRSPETPHLDRYCVAALIESQQDSFLPDHSSMLMLREMMISSIMQADVVGVLGLWRPPKIALGPRRFADALNRNLGSFTGHWRGVELMLQLASTSLPRSKTIASAHPYLGILQHLPLIIETARDVVLNTDSSKVLGALSTRFPDVRFTLIPVDGCRDPIVPFPDGPHFLAKIAEALPRDLAGCCCLVGAGPWAEIYCTWIKQRGGVAIDIGSGFDLLAGRISRRIHQALGYVEENPFTLDDNAKL